MISKTEELYRAVWENEVQDLFQAKDHPEFFAALEQLIEDGNLNDKETLKDIAPPDLKKEKNDSVRAIAHILAFKEIYHRQTTSQLAKGLKSQLEKAERTTKAPLLFGSFDLNTGTPKEVLLKLCWISYALGCRAVHQVDHTKTMSMLSDLFRGIAMNPAGRDLSNRKGQNRNQNLKDWFFSICSGLQKELYKLPGKKCLETFIERRISDFEQKQNLLIFKTEGKIRHRDDPPTSGVTISTMTDSWRKDYLRNKKNPQQ
ncbi:hypothetical protein N9195_01525 [bacterium]|nr:hypothetical protein [bacterium]